MSMPQVGWKVETLVRSFAKKIGMAGCICFFYVHYEGEDGNRKVITELSYI